MNFLVAFLSFLCTILVLATTVQSSSLLNKHFALSSSRKHPSSTTSFQPMNAVDPFPDNPTYVSLGLFADSSCQSATTVQNYVVNLCMASEKESVKYTCENGFVNKNVYQDTTCTNLSSSSSSSLPANHCFPSGEGSSSIKNSYCNITNAYDYPDGNYFVMTTYQSDTCNEEILETTALANGYCFVGDGDSVMYKWPYMYYYSNSQECVGSRETTDISPYTCPYMEHADDDNDYVKYNSYYSLSHVVVGDDGDDDDNSDDSLSGWEIAVIVVCSVIGFVLIAGGVYYFLVMRKKSAPMSSQAKANNPEAV